MTTDEKELVAAAKRDPAQFAALYQRYYRSIFNYFWYRTGHDTDVSEDLTQDTFVQAFQALSRFRDRGVSYGSYLLTIAHNRLCNHYRTHGRTVPIDTVPDIPLDIRTELAEQDDLRCLWRAIQHLSPTERDVLYLRYRRGYSVRAIAGITDKSENAIKLHISRARKKLAKHPELNQIARFGDVPKHPPRTPRYQTAI